MNPLIDEVIVFSHSSLLRCVAPVALLGLLTACGGDETQGTEDHTPRDYSVLIDDQAVTPPYAFLEGETVRFRIKFFNEAGEDLDNVESSHFAGITFNPPSLAASVDRVTDHNYQFDVTGGTPGTGTLTVHYGHDALADEVSFPAVAVTVGSSGGNGNPQ